MRRAKGQNEVRDGGKLTRTCCLNHQDAAQSEIWLLLLMLETMHLLEA